MAPPASGGSRPVPDDVASFGQRLGAALLDSLLITVVLMLAVAVAVAVGVGLAAAGTPEALGVALVIVGFLAFFAAVSVGQVAYHAGFTSGEHGATVGKWLVGIEVVDEREGGRPPRGRSLGRAAMYLFASTQVFYLGCLWMLWDERRRTWHDMVTDTHVVVRRGPRPSLGELLRSWSLREA